MGWGLESAGLVVGLEWWVRAFPGSDRLLGGSGVVCDGAFRCHLSEGAEGGCDCGLADGIMGSGWDAEGREVRLEDGVVQGADVADRKGDESDFQPRVE